MTARTTFCATALPLAALVALVALVACAPPPGAGRAGQSTLLDRTPWHTMPTAARAEHARALLIALETRERTPVAWSAGPAAGEITVLSTSDLGRTPVCRTFADRLMTGGRPTKGRDAACWTKYGWIYIAPGPARAVIAPAVAAGDRMHTTRRTSTTLARVARRTRTDLATLRKLNPLLARRLPRGTRVVLP